MSPPVSNRFQRVVPPYGSEAFDAVEAAGGTAQKTVSGKTDVLVRGDGAGRRKAEAAVALGVRVIDVDEFLRILAGDADAAAAAADDDAPPSFSRGVKGGV